MNMRRIIAVFACAAVFMTAALWWAQVPHEQATGNYRQVLAHIGDAAINADVSDTEPLREQGLSGRESLSEKEGMLFVFQEDGMHAFWMKDMLIPIDMIWLSSDKRVVFIERNAQPESYPASFAPPVPSRYVLEVPSGFSDRHAIAVGTTATWD